MIDYPYYTRFSPQGKGKLRKGGVQSEELLEKLTGPAGLTLARSLRARSPQGLALDLDLYPQKRIFARGELADGVRQEGTLFAREKASPEKDPRTPVDIMGANQPGQKFQARRPRSGQKEPANLIVNALKIGNTRFSGKRLRRRFKRGKIHAELFLF